MKKLLFLSVIAFVIFVSHAFSVDQEAWVYQDWIDNDWENTSRVVNSFEGDLPLLMIYQNWENEKWNFDERNYFEYDTKNRMTLYSSQEFENENWVDVMKMEYFYENDNMSKNVLWVYDEDLEELVIMMEYHFSYDMNGNLIKDENYMFMEEEKILFGDSQYKYDSKNRNVEIVTRNFDYMSFELANFSKETMTYVGSNDSPLETIYQIWDGDDWMNSEKNLYSYIKDNLWNENIVQMWDGDDWMNTEKNIIQRNNKDLVIADILQLWQGDWVNESRVLTEYDDELQTRNLDQTYTNNNWLNSDEELFNYGPVNKLVLTLNRTWEDQDWVNVARGYLEGFLSADTEALEEMMLRVYPNPVSSQLKTSYTLNDVAHVSARIFDINGQYSKVIVNATQFPGANEFSADMSGYPNGTYLLDIQINGKHFIKKIIISK